MDKKDYLKGVVTGIAVCAVIAAGVFLTSPGRSFIAGRLVPNTKAAYIQELLDRLYVDEVDEDTVYKAMVDSVGDKYTQYFTADEYKAYMEKSSGTFFGIGVTVTEDKDGKGTLVIGVLEDSPAEKAGLKEGDYITTVDGEDIRGMSVDDAAAAIKGEKGTQVSIIVFREATGETLQFDIIRDEVISRSVSSRMIDEIGYIQITGFKKNTYDEFRAAYDGILSENPKGLIIDVRNNPGGLFKVVGEIVDDLVGEGVYVSTVDKSGKKVEYTSDAECIEIPLCVLVNGYSASASEILSAAVQDMGAGILVGENTFGKGLVQGLYPISDGSGVKITIQKYYTPNGVCIQGEGIAPDVEVSLPDGYIFSGQIDLENDTQLLKALELLK